MDYKLAALKVTCRQLRDARKTNSTPPSMSLFGILFQRAWIQGVLVSGSEEGRFLIDDGSDVVELSLANESSPHNWKKGLYVMVVGLYVPASADDPALIKVHKIVDLTPYPDREAMWHLEVMEAYQLFYLPVLE
ncbi:uncharacterized protein LOC109840452 [Asparagus officinalis]|uniref:uncharacterized protein LOC109840452 n=1 Tax=Asparagus officinalis TaxID=4686 RepID=UPI00098E2465|nr:uncharacterized protein LOC109840452 [Asparagus officinalis]